MFKIFYEPRCLTICHPHDGLCQEKEITIESNDKKLFELFLDWTKDPSFGNAIIKHEDPSTLFSVLCSGCKNIKAAGGLVINPENEILMIFRKGKWDLPKGKIEGQETAEETAIREVEEECGVGLLRIVSRLPATNHVYIDEKERWVMKTTHWYHMIAQGWQKPVPQFEEDIEQAIWATRKEAERLMEKSYSSIAYLLQWFFTRGADSY